MRTYNKILLPTRPQPDTLVGIFLLKTFGGEKYPGIGSAQVEVLTAIPESKTPESFDQEGTLLIDIGKGKFDHHALGKTASLLIAEDLGIANSPAIAKLLAYAERDDKFGMGTISQDKLDKAFGLSGLVAALNKSIPQGPNEVVDYVIPFLTAHFIEEKKRTEDLPQEYKEKTENGKAQEFLVKHKGKNIKAVNIESDDPSMAGWLRSGEGIKADVVIQKTGAGYVNIMTRPLKKVDLREVAALVRTQEALARNRQLFSKNLTVPGRIPEVSEWYYDRATNSLLNGTANPQGISATALSLETILECVKQGLSASVLPIRAAPRTASQGPHQYFLEIRFPKEIAQELRNLFEEAPEGIKFHLPENYHLTLLYLGTYEAEELPGLASGIATALEGIKQFPLTIATANFRSGMVAGYPGKSFYFEIEPSQGATDLRGIRGKLEALVPKFQEQEFSPHVTVATAIPNVDEKIIENTEIKPVEKQEFEFPVSELRLTEVQRNENRITYHTKKIFSLE